MSSCSLSLIYFMHHTRYLALALGPAMWVLVRMCICICSGAFGTSEKHGAAKGAVLSIVVLTAAKLADIWRPVFHSEGLGVHRSSYKGVNRRDFSGFCCWPKMLIILGTEKSLDDP